VLPKPTFTLPYNRLISNTFIKRAATLWGICNKSFMHTSRNTWKTRAILDVCKTPFFQMQLTILPAFHMEGAETKLASGIPHAQRRIDQTPILPRDHIAVAVLLGR
jgi:hypothetical protein